mmetsp:Transcript_17795/g.54046  ORF Transcript_17795/g.54046 Transcript_17795/m.54046 type:complete len:431 (-) Transcript_17795:53-1345(-)
MLEQGGRLSRTSVLARQAFSSPRPWKEPLDVPRPRVQPREVGWEELPPPQVEEFAKLETSASPVGRPTHALKKTMKMLETMRKLRRIGRKDEAEVPAAGAAGAPSEERQAAAAPATQAEGPEAAQAAAAELAKAQEEEDALLRKTLKDLTDTSASLREKADDIDGAQKVVEQCGGARHATQVMTGRTLAIMRRKAEVLAEVEERFAVYQAAHARCEEILNSIAKDGAEAPPDLCGVRKFVAAHTHRPTDPADADKSDFGAFAKSFLLPARHDALERFRKAYDEASDWWAKTTARTAAAGARGPVIRTLMALSVAAGAEKDHPYLVRAEIVLRDRIADKVLEDAKEAQERDEAAAKKAELVGQVPLVGMAEKAAVGIDTAMQKAIREGVDECDARMKEAKAIAKQLREADGVRKRLHNRQKNPAAQAPKKG